jgi:hypothetical protein
MSKSPFDIFDKVFDQPATVEPPADKPEATRRSVASGLLPFPARPLHLDAYAPDPSSLDVFPPADAIADQCAQLGHLRETKGNVSYPQWWGNIGILAYSDDGERLAHEWSSGHLNYARRETQQKLDDWLARKRCPRCTSCAAGRLTLSSLEPCRQENFPSPL